MGGGVKAEENPSDITLTVWSWTEEVEQMLDHYTETHPDSYNFNFVLVGFDEYQQLLDTALMTGSDEAPDLITGDLAFFKKYVNSDFTLPLEDLGIDVDAETAAAGSYQYTVDLGTSDDGLHKGLAHQGTAGSFIYRRSIAKEYLGTDDPDEVAEYIKDWDTLFETAELLKEKSDGKVCLVSGNGDIHDLFFYNRTSDFVVDGKLVVEDVILDYFRISKKLVENGYTTDNAKRFQEAWYGNIKGINDKQILGTFGAPWVLAYQVMPNCGEEGGEGTWGDWAICKPPVNFFGGGTWFMASSATKHPEAVGEIIRYMTLDATEEGNLYWWATDKGDFVNSATINNTLGDGYEQPFCQGENTIALWSELGKEIEAPVITAYDQTVDKILGEEVRSYTEGSKDLQTAVNDFMSRVAEVIDCEIPEITVEE